MDYIQVYDTLSTHTASMSSGLFFLFLLYLTRIYTITPETLIKSILLIFNFEF